MDRPITRLLGFLELLESRPTVTGAEAARRLDVDARTVRRYVAALQDLGIPVEGQRGAAGGYRLRPRPPPPPADARRRRGHRRRVRPARDTAARAGGRRPGARQGAPRPAGVAA